MLYPLTKSKSNLQSQYLLLKELESGNHVISVCGEVNFLLKESHCSGDLQAETRADQALMRHDRQH